jgi:hypothetical protein
VLQRVSRWFVSRPERTYTPTDAIGWWELRRIPFNLLIALYGFPCLLLIHWAADASGKLPPGEDAIEPMAMLLVPFAVNILYTLGWLVEAPLRVIRPTLPNRFGPLLLMLGLSLGCFFCSVPAVCALGMWLLP